MATIHKNPARVNISFEMIKETHATSALAHCPLCFGDELKAQLIETTVCSVCVQDQKGREFAENFKIDREKAMAAATIMRVVDDMFDKKSSGEFLTARELDRWMDTLTEKAYDLVKPQLKRLFI